MSRGGKFARARAKQRLTARQWAFLLVNAALVLCAAAAAIGLRSVTHTLITQDAAQVWRGENEMRFAQVSAFLPVDGKAEAGQVEVFRRSLDQALMDASLEAPNENASLYVDAWSGKGQPLSVSVGKKTVQAAPLAVGGEWFLFHPLPLLSGSYISDRDFMQDRVVLDEDMAWALFGSFDVAGMEVTINGRPFPVAGVVRREADFATDQAYTDGPGLFMSFDAVKALQEDLGLDCYELVMPDVISGFAKSTLTEKFPLNGGLTVQNTGRYGLLRLVEVLGDFGIRSMSTHSVVFPYWENAARLTEDYAALFLLLLVLTAACPLVTACVILGKALQKSARYAGARTKAAVENASERRKEKHYVRTGI